MPTSPEPYRYFTATLFSNLPSAPTSLTSRPMLHTLGLREGGAVAGERHAGSGGERDVPGRLQGRRELLRGDRPGGQGRTYLAERHHHLVAEVGQAVRVDVGAYAARIDRYFTTDGRRRWSGMEVKALAPSIASTPTASVTVLSRQLGIR